GQKYSPGFFVFYTARPGAATAKKNRRFFVVSRVIFTHGYFSVFFIDNFGGQFFPAITNSNSIRASINYRRACDNFFLNL
ncbi:MAG: hypothetical protein ACRC2T_20745, partial [Thermoguttaceae bacterium]